MKRTISSLCVVLLLFTFILVPVSADEYSNDSFFNVLDFATVNGQVDNYAVVPANGSFNYNWSQYKSVYYAELLVNIVGAIPSAVYFETHDRQDILTLDHISGNLYRIYGACGYGSGYSNASIRFVSSATSYVDINSFNLLTVPSNHIDTDAFCEIVSVDYEDTIHFIPTDLINYRIISPAANFQDNNFICYIYSNNWRDYDFLDFQLMFDCLTINSISGVLGSINVPLDISIIDSFNTDGNHFFLNIRMDLRGLDRSTSDFPMITLLGRLNTTVLNSINFLGCSGYVLNAGVDPEIYWYQKIFNSLSNGFSNLGSWITNQTSVLTSEFTLLRSNLYSHFSNLDSWINNQIAAIQTEFALIRSSLYSHFSDLNIWIQSQTSTLENAIRGDSSSGNKFQQDVQQELNELDQAQAVMDSVSKPSVDSIDVSMDRYVSQADITVLAAPMVSLFQGDIIVSVFFMSILLATVSYVLYGKR